MTTKEMIIDVEQKMSKSNGNANRKLETEQIIWFLNNSIMSLFGTHLVPNKEGFMDISEIYYNFYLPFINYKVEVFKKEEYFYELPSESLFVLGGTAKVNSNEISLTNVKYSVSNTISRIPYYKGGQDFINIIQFENIVKVLTSDVDIEKLFITYLRKPNTVTIATNTEVNVLYHQDIVNLTVENLLANINDIEGYKARKETNSSNQILIK